MLILELLWAQVAEARSDERRVTADTEIWRVANLMLKRFGGWAGLECESRAAEFLEATRPGKRCGYPLRRPSPPAPPFAGRSPDAPNEMRAGRAPARLP